MFLFKMLSRIGVLQGVTTSNSSRTTQSSSSRDSFNGGGIRAIGLESSQGNVLVMGRVRAEKVNWTRIFFILFFFLRNFWSTWWFIINCSKAGGALKHWKIIKKSKKKLPKIWRPSLFKLAFWRKLADWTRKS